MPPTKTTPEAFYQQMSKEFSPESFRLAASKGKKAMSELHAAYADALEVVADLHEEQRNPLVANIFRNCAKSHRKLAEEVQHARP